MTEGKSKRKDTPEKVAHACVLEVAFISTHLQQNSYFLLMGRCFGFRLMRYAYQS
jgi:hypothetical protein